MVKLKIRTIILSVLLVPYLISMMGMFTSYVTFFYKTNFQSTVASLDEDKLELIVLSPTEFEKIKWTDGENEFECNGKMFDVARIEHHGDSYFVYCENDSFEDLLISYLKTSGAKTKSAMIYHVHFFEPLRNFDCEKSSLRSLKCTQWVINLYVSVSGELNTPPPKFSYQVTLC